MIENGTKNANNGKAVPKYPVKTLEKALDILDHLSNDGSNRGLGITELSVLTGLSKSAVHRILDTLLYYGYIDKDTETTRYKLGWHIYTVGQKVPQQNQLFNVSTPYLLELNRQVNETVNLGILTGHESVIVSKIEPSGQGSYLHVNTKIGEHETTYATGLGKVMLADLEDEKIVELLKPITPFPRLTEHTITSMNDFLKEIARVRVQGYGLDNRESQPDLFCIAMPVRDYSGRVVAAVSVSSPAARVDDARKEEILKYLAVCTEKLSAALGYIE